ncbi:hypothetical protein LJK87_23300 [Paenibacillus sp. P25]|nr:hypothetical protein LJK87_23300 [Paenibacillus sp. P25]
MNTAVGFQPLLADYLDKFVYLAETYDGTPHHCSELEAVINDYSAFITNRGTRMLGSNWNPMRLLKSPGLLRSSARRRRDALRLWKNIAL